MRDRAAGRRRLEAVAQLVPPGSRVADIGTDHSWLPRHLLRVGRASHCIATERSVLAVRRIEHELDGGPALPGLEIRHGDGLQALRPEDRVEVVILAGLGARAILRVLDGVRAAGVKVRRWVLQPQTEVGRLRRGLAERGCGIVDERLALERGRYYPVIAAEPGRPDRFPDHPILGSDELHEAGPCLVRSADPLVRQFWRRERELRRRLLHGAGQSRARTAARRRLALAEHVLAALEAQNV